MEMSLPLNNSEFNNFDFCNSENQATPIPEFLSSDGGQTATNQFFFTAFGLSLSIGELIPPPPISSLLDVLWE